MIGTDLEVFADLNLDVSQRTGEEALAINLSQLKKAVPSKSGEITVSIDNDKWVTTHDGLKISGKGVNKAEYPNIPVIKRVHRALKHDILPILHGMVPFVSTEELRPALMGIYCHKEGLCATNGHVLYFEPMRFPAAFELIIPSSAMKVLPKSGEISWATDKDFAVFSVGEDNFIFRPIDGTYPDYYRVIPRMQPEARIIVDREELLKALKRLIPHTSTYTKQLNFSPGAGLHISAEDIDAGTNAEIDVEATIKGPFADSSYNADYMQTVLNSLSAERVVLEWHDPNKAVVVRNENDVSGSLRLIMPVLR